MMNKTIKILLICMLLMICIILGFVMSFFIKNDSANINLGSFVKLSLDSNYNMNLVNSYEADVESVNKFYMNLKSTDVEIKESTNDKILVEYYSNVDTNVKIEYKDNTIIIDEEKNNESEKNVFFNVSRKVIMYVPKAYAGEFELKQTSGDTKSEIDLSNSNFNISTQSGDIFLKNLGNADIKTSSGDVSIGNAININITTSSGDILTESGNSVNISTSSGDIKINKIKQKASISSSSGDIFVETLNIEENSNITSSSGDVLIKNNECNCYIETETNSGDGKINKSDRKSDIVLKIKTSSGDIYVEG